MNGALESSSDREGEVTVSLKGKISLISLKLDYWKFADCCYVIDSKLAMPACKRSFLIISKGNFHPKVENWVKKSAQRAQKSPNND